MFTMLIVFVLVVVPLAVLVGFKSGRRDRGANITGTLFLGTIAAFLVASCVTGIFANQLMYQHTETTVVSGKIQTGMVNQTYSIIYTAEGQIVNSTIPAGSVQSILSTTGPSTITSTRTCTNAWGIGGCGGKIYYIISSGPGSGLPPQPS